MTTDRWLNLLRDHVSHSTAETQVRKPVGPLVVRRDLWQRGRSGHLRATTSKIKHAIKLKTSPARSPGRYAVIGCKLKQNANEGCNSCATVVQILQDLFYVLLPLFIVAAIILSFKFYCKFYCKFYVVVIPPLECQFVALSVGKYHREMSASVKSTRSRHLAAAAAAAVAR